MIVKNAASAVIRDDQGRFLLVQRGHHPAKGLWSLPGGSVEPGESLQETARREVFEETGLEISPGAEVWRVSVELAEGLMYDVHAFEAVITGGVLAAADDAAAVAWVAPEDLHTLDLTPQLGEFLAGYSASRDATPGEKDV